jgi:hypothetical protein
MLGGADDLCILPPPNHTGQAHGQKDEACGKEALVKDRPSRPESTFKKQNSRSQDF